MSIAEPTARLLSIAESLKAGDEVEPITVRDFIWWWFAERRSSWTVWKIKRALEQTGLRTVPDFQSTYLDAPMVFVLDSVDDDHELPMPEEIDIEESITFEDPTYRISKLKAANQKIIAVNPEASLEEAITLMMEYDLSQIPVMLNERDVKGMVTWQSIGTRLALNPPKKEARFFMEKAQVVPN